MLFKCCAESPDNILFLKTISQCAHHFGIARDTLRWRVDDNLKSTFSHERIQNATKDVKFKSCYHR